MTKRCPASRPPPHPPNPPPPPPSAAGGGSSLSQGPPLARPGGEQHQCRTNESWQQLTCKLAVSAQAERSYFCADDIGCLHFAYLPTREASHALLRKARACKQQRCMFRLDRASPGLRLQRQRSFPQRPPLRCLQRHSSNARVSAELFYNVLLRW